MEANDIKRLSGMLGLAMRARKLSYGCDLVADGIRKAAKAKGLSETERTQGNANQALAKGGLVLLAADASGNTRKRIINCCRHYGTRLYALPMTKSELSACMGRMADTAVVGVFDPGFIRALTPMVAGCESIGQDTEEKTTETKNAQGEDTGAGGNEL